MMSSYQLHNYGEELVEKNVDLTECTLVNVKVASRIVKYNRIAYTEEEGHNIEICDRAIVVTLPMSEDEKAAIYEIIDTKAYATKSLGGSKKRLYDFGNMKLLKQITHAGINKKLYTNNSSSYKK